MGRPMKVWACGVGAIDRLVAAPTKKAAAAAMGLSLYGFNLYACETGNKEQIAVAMTQPGVLFTRSNRFHGDLYQAKKGA